MRVLRPRVHAVACGRGRARRVDPRGRDGLRPVAVRARALRARSRLPRGGDPVSFRPEALDFLRRLEAHNEREWFHAHRDEYDILLLEPARDFVEAFGALSERLGEGVDADPRVGRSIMRINRDTRFSRDKRPYKTHLALGFPKGPGPSCER